MQMPPPHARNHAHPSHDTIPQSLHPSASRLNMQPYGTQRVASSTSHIQPFRTSICLLPPSLSFSCRYPSCPPFIHRARQSASFLALRWSGQLALPAFSCEPSFIPLTQPFSHVDLLRMFIIVAFPTQRTLPLVSLVFPLPSLALFPSHPTVGAIPDSRFPFHLPRNMDGCTYLSRPSSCSRHSIRSSVHIAAASGPAPAPASIMIVAQLIAFGSSRSLGLWRNPTRRVHTFNCIL